MPWTRHGLWLNPDFLRLWAAQAISALGSRITRTALPVIAILTLGATPAQIALLGALSSAPQVVVGLLAGGLVDRSPKRPLLIATDLARAALILAVPLAAWLGHLHLVHLYLVAALVGAATSLFQIADNTYLPTLVGPDHLVEANARLEGTDAVAEIAGPGAAGLLIKLLSGPLTMVADAASYVASAILLLRIRAVEAPPPPPDTTAGTARASLLEDLRVGLRHGFGHPAVGPTFLAIGLHAFFGGFFYALYMLYTLETLRLDPATVGLVIGVGGVGGLAGTALAGLLGRRLGPGPTMLVSMIVGQLGGLLVPLAARLGPLTVPALILHQLLGDAFLVAFFVHAVSLRQTLLPLPVLGRVSATLHVLTGVLLPAGTLLAGWLAGHLGVETVVWIAALGSLTAALPLLRPAVLRRLPQG